MIYLFCLTPNLFKTFQECQHYEDSSLNEYDLKGHASHKRQLLCPNHSSTFVFGPIFTKIGMNANITKTQFLRK